MLASSLEGAGVRYVQLWTRPPTSRLLACDHRVRDLGAFIGGAFAVLLALGGIGLALVILAITLVVNLLLENLLEPVLLGGSLDLHPLLILLATSLGGIIAGMIGLILAAPALAILLHIKRELRTAGFFNDSSDRP